MAGTIDSECVYCRRDVPVDEPHYHRAVVWFDEADLTGGDEAEQRKKPAPGDAIKAGTLTVEIAHVTCCQKVFDLADLVEPPLLRGEDRDQDQDEQ